MSFMFNTDDRHCITLFMLVGKLNQKSPIVNIFNTINLAHFENCPIAIKKARTLTNEYFYEQTLNEIRICSKIGYHRNVCTMLGYVSNARITCLLLELAHSNLLTALVQMRLQMIKNDDNDQDLHRYLNKIIEQIVDGMVKQLIIWKLCIFSFLLLQRNWFIAIYRLAIFSYRRKIEQWLNKSIEADNCKLLTVR